MNKDFENYEYIHSNVTGEDYLPRDGIRLINIKQSTLYIKNGCKLLDLYTSIDRETGEPILCFIFDRKDSRKYFDLWCNHELR